MDDESPHYHCLDCEWTGGINEIFHTPRGVIHTIVKTVNSLIACGVKSNALTFGQYQLGAETTAIYPGRGSVMGVVYVALGMGEAGEIQNKVKKILRDANGALTPETKAKIKDEVGDLLWYIAMMATELGTTMEDIARENLLKLADRKTRGVLRGDGDKR